MYYVVKYSGPFGFIKPWTAVRDEETFTQCYLTGSILEGMRQKLGVSSIIRNRLSYDSFSLMQERTLPKQIKREKNKQIGGIIKRRVMINPVLHLGFNTEDEALLASEQHLCLCRNEDLILPVAMYNQGEFNFDAKEGEQGFIAGFEYHPSEGPDGVFHGWNRFTVDENGFAIAQYGRIETYGHPMRIGEDINLR